MDARLGTPCFAVVVLLAAAVGAEAQVTFELTPVTIPTGTDIVDGVEFPSGTPGAVLGNLDGYVCQDLKVETTADWTAAAMLVELTNGTIYQETEGIVATSNDGYKIYNGQTSRLPDSSMFASMPSSQFDTYIHGNGSDATLVGAGGDAGGDLQRFDSAEVDVSWNGPSSSTDDTGTVGLGRFTFTNDAAGLWRLVITRDGDTDGILITGTISNGVMQFDP